MLFKHDLGNGRYITHKPYWFSEEQILKIEEFYKAKYMGPWCVKSADGGWANWPVEVFYQPNPDKDKGHSHYLGLFYRDKELRITNAEGAFDATIRGIVCPDGEVLVSRYRHDAVSKDDCIADGGRDYDRFLYKGTCNTIVIAPDKDKFISVDG